MKKLILTTAATAFIAIPAFAQEMGINQECAAYMALDDEKKMESAQVMAQELEAADSGIIKKEDRVAAYVMEAAKSACEAAPDNTVAGALDKSIEG